MTRNVFVLSLSWILSHWSPPSSSVLGEYRQNTNNHFVSAWNVDLFGPAGACLGILGLPGPGLEPVTARGSTDNKNRRARFVACATWSERTCYDAKLCEFRRSLQCSTTFAKTPHISQKFCPTKSHQHNQSTPNWDPCARRVPVPRIVHAVFFGQSGISCNSISHVWQCFG